MGILNYPSRSENAMTSQHFQWCEYEDSWSTVVELVSGHKVDVARGRMFAKPWRDYFHTLGIGYKRAAMQAMPAIAGLYEQLFAGLQQQIFAFEGFSLSVRKGYLQEQRNYNPTNHEGLFRNLYNTEIDVLIEDDSSIYVGEAKGEMSFNANATHHMLVHQLVRQFVTASIWAAYEAAVIGEGNQKLIVPFIVSDREKLPKLRNNNQVQFLLHNGWLSPDKLIAFEDISQLRLGVGHTA